MAQRIAGTAFLKVDGNMLPLRGNFTVSPSAVERTFLAETGGHSNLQVGTFVFIPNTALQTAAGQAILAVAQANGLSAAQVASAIGDAITGYRGNLVDFIVGRALDQLGLENSLVRRWGQ